MSDKREDIRTDYEARPMRAQTLAEKIEALKVEPYIIIDATKLPNQSLGGAFLDGLIWCKRAAACIAREHSEQAEKPSLQQISDEPEPMKCVFCPECESVYKQAVASQVMSCEEIERAIRQTENTVNGIPETVYERIRAGDYPNQYEAAFDAATHYSCWRHKVIETIRFLTRNDLVIDEPSVAEDALTSETFARLKAWQSEVRRQVENILNENLPPAANEKELAAHLLLSMIASKDFRPIPGTDKWEPDVLAALAEQEARDE